MLFIGLGNPGGKYEHNRHNFGFMAVDAIHAELKAPPFAEKFGGAYSRIGELHLFKPLSFMNNSGVPAAQAASFFKIPLASTYVFYDELDVELGKIKIKQGGGDGGHNGIKSLDSHMGHTYWRVRLGIGHPGNKDLVHSHVLSDFSKDESQLAEKVCKTLAANIRHLTEGTRELFLSKYSEVMIPPRPKPPKPEIKLADEEGNN